MNIFDKSMRVSLKDLVCELVFLSLTGWLTISDDLCSFTSVIAVKVVVLPRSLDHSSIVSKGIT